MTAHDSRRTGILRLRHLMEKTEAVEEEMIDERARFARLAKPESATRAVSSFNLFQTPEKIARRMASCFPTTGRTLEPSAGLGRLFRAIRDDDNTCHVTLVEQSATLCGELYALTTHDPDCRLIQGDFLAQSPDVLGLFDRIMMNPPFKMGTDIKHITHARRFLAPGGRLVALCANGPRQRDKLQPIADEWHPLPAGSFKCEGTGVDVVMLVIDNP
jgi:hypothetical protein